MADFGQYFVALEGILEQYGLTLIDSLLILILLMLAVFIALMINHHFRYEELKSKVVKDMKELEKEGKALKKLEQNLSKYETGGAAEDLEHWSEIEKALEELATLPELEESPDEILLKIYVSPLMKEFVDVSAEKNRINVNINPKEGIPIESSYQLPADIDPHNLLITYKGNTLEIHAPRVINVEKEE